MAPGRNKMQLIQLCWESFNLNFLVQHDAPLYKQITMLRHAMIGLYQILQCCQEIDNLEFINRQRSLLRTPYNWHNIISEQKLGLSSTSYQHKEETPIYGTGQESGNNSPSFQVCYLIALKVWHIRQLIVTWIAQTSWIST